MVFGILGSAVPSVAQSDSGVVTVVIRTTHGDITADIADPDLAEHLQLAQVDVAYELAVWPLIESVGEEVTVHLTGDVQWRDGQQIHEASDSPLLVSFPQGGGQVYFTTYRNSTNSEGNALAALQYLLSDLNTEDE